MIKTDIVGNISNTTGMDKKSSYKMVEFILKTLKSTLEQGDEVIISGFGKFSVRHKKSRVGRNPRNMMPYEISERTVVIFNPVWSKPLF